jgi:hypothetical protein
MLSLLCVTGAHGALSVCVASLPVDSSYTITTTVRLAPPYDLAAMNDEFQSARLLKEEDGTGVFEITFKPFHEQKITANPHWQQDDAKMTEYLRPRPAANWDPELRQQILSDLRDGGIEPDKLDDKTLVERVSSWAMQRADTNSQFGIWMVAFEKGVPHVDPALRTAFREQEPPLSDDALFQRELFGKGMYETRSHGSCTSTSTYLATVLRAIGIPTRIVLMVPACDPNDPKQINLLTTAVRHHRISRSIRAGLANGGFVNHVFNEVWVGGKWVRLNYNRLGQPIVDSNYLGLMMHVYTAKDISEVPFSTTWGARFANNAGPKLSSVNPYQMLTAKDDLRPGVVLDNPTLPNLTSATVIAILRHGDPAMPEWVKLPPGTDALLLIREWLKDDNYMQLRFFEQGAGREFTLSAPGKATIRVVTTGAKFSNGNGTFQAFGIALRDKPEPGVSYTLTPDNTVHPNQWRVAEDVTWRE